MAKIVKKMAKKFNKKGKKNWQIKNGAVAKIKIKSRKGQGNEKKIGGKKGKIEADRKRKKIAEHREKRPKIKEKLTENEKKIDKKTG